MGFPCRTLKENGTATTNGEVKIPKKIAKLIEEYDQFIDGEGTEFLSLLRSGKK